MVYMRFLHCRVYAAAESRHMKGYFAFYEDGTGHSKYFSHSQRYFNIHEML